MTSVPLVSSIVADLVQAGNPANVAGMARYGIRSRRVLGVSAPWLRARAKALGHDHALALALWKTGIFEARLLAGLVDEPGRVTVRQMEAWARDFDSWALCDGICCNLFDRTPFAWAKAYAWAARPEEYVRRAGFVLVAALALHDRRAPDAAFAGFLSAIEAHEGDPRPMVKKGVSWALRHIGKRNPALNAAAVAVARRLARSPDASARWVGRDALRELTDERTVARIRSRRDR